VAGAGRVRCSRSRVGDRAGQIRWVQPARPLGRVPGGARAEHGRARFCMRELPVGTSYAVWVGIGAVLTVSYAMVFTDEPASPLKLLLLAGIVGCVVGLKVIN
jgi:hypothetical protein